MRVLSHIGGRPTLPAEELVPEGSPDHHAPTQIQPLAHRPAAAGGHQINGTINVTNPETVVLGTGIATLVSNGGNTIPSTADVNGIRIGGLLFDAGTTTSAQLVRIGPAGSSPVTRATRPCSRTCSPASAAPPSARPPRPASSPAATSDNTGGAVNSGGIVADLTSYN